MARFDDLYSEAMALYPFDGADPDVVLALRKAYVDGAHRAGRPLVEHADGSAT